VQLLRKYGGASFLGALESSGLAKHPFQAFSFKASGVVSAAEEDLIVFFLEMDALFPKMVYH